MAPQLIKDPTLPPGWEALYDDAQRVTYYWNRATNVTTYDRPAGPSGTTVSPTAVTLESGTSSCSQNILGIFELLMAVSFHTFDMPLSETESSLEPHGQMLSFELKKSFLCLQIKAAYPDSNGTYDANGASNGYAQASYGPSGGSATYSLSAEEYRRKHDLTVMGDNTPDPIQDFQSAGFTQDILDEVLQLQHGLQPPYTLLLVPQVAV